MTRNLRRKSFEQSRDCADGVGERHGSEFIGGWRCGKSFEVREWDVLGRRLRAAGLWSRTAARSCECAGPVAASNIQDQNNRKQDCRSPSGAVPWPLLATITPLGCSQLNAPAGLEQSVRLYAPPMTSVGQCTPRQFNSVPGHHPSLACSSGQRKLRLASPGRLSTIARCFFGRSTTRISTCGRRTWSTRTLRPARST